MIFPRQISSSPRDQLPTSSALHIIYDRWIGKQARQAVRGEIKASLTARWVAATD